MIKIIFLLIISYIQIQALSYTSQAKKWGLFGAIDDIILANRVQGDCAIFVYNNTEGKYMSYVPSKGKYEVDIIKKAEGFFMTGANDKSCTIIENTPTESANYTIKITMKWTKITHPVDYPSGDHFSPFFLTVLKNNTSLYQEGQLASRGIKIMSETGGTSTLQREVNTLIGSSKALSFKKGSGLSSGEGQIVFRNIKLTKSFPKLSIVSMIAPSPDWFVSLGKTLYDNTTNTWIDNATETLVVWDAGTDSGVSYNSADSPTSPAKSVKKIVKSPLGDGNKAFPIGTIEITRE